MKRREFLYKASVINLLIAHDAFAGTWPWFDLAENNKEESNLLLKLELLTACPIHKLVRFYGKLLGLPILMCNEYQMSLQAGRTTIYFVKIDHELAPFYHFAFNIPENKIEGALAWQKERSEIIPTPEHMMDRNYSNDIRHFRNWNAHAVFFQDPAGNVLEYIARHDLDNGVESSDFSSNDILYASEIAFIVDDVSTASMQISDATRLGFYQNVSDRFAPVGSETGLMLFMKRGRIWNAHTSKPLTPQTHKTVVYLDLPGSGNVQIGTYPYQIHY